MRAVTGGLHSLEIWRESRMNAHIHQTEVYKLPGKLPGLVSCYLVIQWRDRDAPIPARCLIGPAIASDRLGLVFWEPDFHAARCRRRLHLFQGMKASMTKFWTASKCLVFAVISVAPCTIAVAPMSASASRIPCDRASESTSSAARSEMAGVT